MENKRKKILFVITQGFWGGAQRYVFDLASSLNSEFEISVLVGEKSVSYTHLTLPTN